MSLKFLSKKNKTAEAPQLRSIPEFCAASDKGLSSLQVRERMENGCANVSIEPPTKTVGQIIRSNLLTYFNLVFFALAICEIAVGAWKELTFMPVVFANILIGIAQELKSKKTWTSFQYSARQRA